LLLLLPCEVVTQKHVDVASSYIGTVEPYGNNRSSVIDAWNKAVHAALGSPYCASAVSAWLEASGVAYPTVRTARARGFIVRKAIEAGRILRGEVKVKKGDLIIWQRAGGGHIGVAAEDWQSAHGKVIEANTSSGRSGSQWNGNGVWTRQRRITPQSAFRITHVVKVVYAR